MKTLSLLVLLALAGSSCKKDDPQASLPEATHEGRNTAGCLINGEPFVATGWGSGPVTVPAINGGFAYDSAYHLRMNGKFKGQNVTVSIFIANAPRTSNQSLTKVYLFDKDTPYYPPAIHQDCLNHAFINYSDGSNELHGTDAQHTGKVELTHVNLSRSMTAGTFEFTAGSRLDPTKTFTVTNGRFDVKP